jgi:hypothetical protein
MNDAANENQGFKVGDGATYIIGSDEYPVTVREVSKTGARVTVTKDRVRKGTLFIPQDDGDRMVFTRRQDGKYRLAGKSGLLVPGRAAHWDPQF